MTDSTVRRQLCFKITTDHHRMLKIIAANLDMTQRDALEDMISQFYNLQQNDPQIEVFDPPRK